MGVVLVAMASPSRVADDILAGRFSCSWIFCSKDSINAEVVAVPVDGAPCSTGAGIST